MKFTNENSNILHEVGHFLMYTLYLTSKRNFSREVFISEMIEISIVPDGDSIGHIRTGSDIEKKRFSLCRPFVLLGGVLSSLYFVDHTWETKFSSVHEIKSNFPDIYYNNGGGKDLLTLLRNDRSMGYEKTARYIYELRKIMFDLWDNRTIRKIVRQLYRGLQKDRCLRSERCYNIIKPHVPELKKLGRHIYNPITKIKINAKVILF